MKKLGILLVGLLLTASLAAASGPWVIVANTTEATVSIIDLGTTPPTVYGPFLGSQLGSQGGELLDVAVTPDGKTAFLSNFGSRSIFKLDVSTPTNPVLKDTIDVAEMFVEDISISRDGTYAVVSDGGFSNTLIFFKLTNFKKYEVYTIKTENTSAQSSTITPDGMLIVCDYFNSRILYGPVNAARTGLSSEKKLTIDSNPLNAAVSPDGATVAVAAYGSRKVHFLKSSGGTITPGTGGIAVNGYPQSVAFSPDGTKAYAVCGAHHVNSGDSDVLSWFRITGAGQAILGGEIPLPTRDQSAFFGVDTISITPNGGKAVIGYQTSFTAPDFPDHDLRLVDLNSFAVSTIPMHKKLSAGVACFDPAQSFGSPFPPLDAAIVRFARALSAYGESINRLSWKANPQNLASIAEYRVYAKVKDAPDSEYSLLARVPASASVYNDRGLNPKTSYSYRITAVNLMNKESSPVVIAN